MEDRMQQTDCSWTEGRVSWGGRGRGNDGILLKTGTAFVDDVGGTEVEVGEAMTGLLIVINRFNLNLGWCTKHLSKASYLSHYLKIREGLVNSIPPLLGCGPKLWDCRRLRGSGYINGQVLKRLRPA